MSEQEKSEEQEIAEKKEEEERTVRFEVPGWSGHAIGTECFSEHPCSNGMRVGVGVLWSFGWQTTLSLKKGSVGIGGPIHDAVYCPLCGADIPFDKIKVALQESFSLETKMLERRREALRQEMNQYLYRISP